MARRSLSIGIVLGLLVLGLLLGSTKMAFALTTTPTPAGNIGYRTIAGKVTDSVTGAAIAGATLTCSHSSYVSGTKCTGTTTTAADGTYSFGSVYIHDTDSIVITVQATGYTSQSVTRGGVSFVGSGTVNFALVPTVTITPTNTVGTPVITPTRTPTRTPTATSATGTCSPVSATITSPFAWDGAGTLCWQAATLGTYINSWSLTSLSINGVNYTNMYATVSSLPAKIGGYWYISYNSSVAWGHFEAK